MTHSTIQRLTSQYLGLDPAQSGLIAMQEYRTAVITAHRPRSTSWRWCPTGNARAMTAIIFAADDSLSFDDACGVTTPMAGGMLIHSTQAGSISWNPGATGTIVWLGTDSVLATGVAEASAPFALSADALTAGFRSFAETVVHGADFASPVSTYFVERLLLEMTLGIMLQKSDLNVPAATADRPINRARTLMLLNRSDPEYGVEELAADLHVSVRQLQRLFSAEGTTTPAGALRALRVELAEHMLRDPLYDVMSIPQLAHYAGFANAAMMRRALRDHGHPIPQSLRARI